MIKMIQIQWTAANLEEARTVASRLVQEKLVACANIIPSIESIYSWEGKIETGQEVEVLFKTQEHHFEAVQETIEEHASYEVPAILKFSIAEGNPAYFKWMKETT